MEKARTTSFRLDERYYIGIELVKAALSAKGYHSPKMSAIVKMGLDKVFEELGITQEDIQARLKEDQP